MSSMKKSESKNLQDANVSAERAEQDESHEMLLHREYDTLTENLSTLKRRVAQLRKENEFLQNELDWTRKENVEFISYLSNKAEKRQNAIVTQSHQELEKLQRQRQNMQDKHEEKKNELEREILQTENQLAKLNIEIADLKEVKTLQQQQLCCITELERELTSLQSHHSKTLVALKADVNRKMKSLKQQAKDQMQALTTSANKLYHSMMSSTNVVHQQNKSLCEELKNLVLRDEALRSQWVALRNHQRQLLLDRECVQKLRTQRISSCSKSTTPAGANNKEHPQRNHQ
ncbi:cytadherence high molecular weight protein 2 isoform X2 [Pimephales promelas]|uniref:cytadherence high molecular weight protein 2 isoform X2 n=1 Tax=Pimephales promelas TaxID=90988 RepID=UPI001955C7BD|nr:cytadherence high molecular weight protein 2 isoform X2 [Pimephales promelas]